MTKPVARRTARPPKERVLPVRPQGLGHLRGWETEVSLPVAGTFTAPAKGSLRADAVLIAPEDDVPVLFVEVDNHTEPAEVVARKLVRYRAFFRRQVKDHRGRDIPLWSTLWDDSGRGGYPPVALVFTKDVGPEARMRRMKKIKEASRACWEGRWHTDTGWQPPVDGEEQDGWWDFTDTVPVIATHLEHLRANGPHGAVWWRFGRSTWQPLTDALTNTRTKAEHDARDEQRRIERERVLEDRQRRERFDAAWPWPCPSCGTDVSAGMTGEDGYRPERGGLCPRCEHASRELEHERRAEDAGPANGIMARLRARVAER